MKILLVNKYHYVRGGSETYYFGLAELLKNAGHEVIFFAMQDDRNVSCEQESFFVSNVEFNGILSVWEKLKAAARLVYSFEAKKKMGMLLDEEKPDIIHINLFHRVLTASIVDAAKQRKIPVVFTMHDLNCLCPNHTMLDHGKICEACLHGNYWHCVKRVCFKDSRLKCVMAAIESSYNRWSDLYNKFDLIITPSEFYKQKLLESGITKCKVEHMKNFLPPDTTYEVSGKRGNYIFFYGRLSHEKGILTLIDAMQYVGRDLLIAGTGPEENNIRAKINEFGLQSKIHLLGFKRGSELWSLVKNCACVVVPSEWYEASGYTACEAQALGKPVIVTDAGGLPENIVSGETGYVCAMFDSMSLAQSINKVLNLSDQEYENMSQKAVLNAKRLFDAQEYTSKLVYYYRSLASKENNM